MEGSRDSVSDYGEPESTQLKADLRMFMTSNTSDSDSGGRLQAERSLVMALTDGSMNNWTAYEMIVNFDIFASEQPDIVVLYAYYALIKKIVDESPDAPIPESLMRFIEQEAHDREEFGIVVEMGMMDFHTLNFREQSKGPMDKFKEYIGRKRHELDAYVTFVSSELVRAYSESVAEFSRFHGESYALEKELIDKHFDKPGNLRNAIAAGQIRTDQGMAMARLRHDCELISQNGGSLIDQQNVIKQYILLTAEGRMAMVAQFEYGLVATHEGEPERLKGLMHKDLRTTSAKSLAAALYDEHLINQANGNTLALYDTLNSHRFLSKQGKETAKKILSEQQ